MSRERLLVGTPVAAALVCIGVLAFVDGWPRFARLQEQHERLEELRQKQASLPGLQRQLAHREARAQEVARQQALLVDLIAGRERIQTFLAEVGRVADATGVLINAYEPLAPAEPNPPEQQPSSQGRSTSSNETPPPPKDPLTELGYQKTSVLLQAQGPYEALLAFLRRMESLQLLVQPSNLELEALEQNPSAKDAAILTPPLTELKLRLNFFDRIQDPQVQAATSQPPV